MRQDAPVFRMTPLGKTLEIAQTVGCEHENNIIPSSEVWLCYEHKWQCILNEILCDRLGVS